MCSLEGGVRAMGYNACNDEIRDNVTRMQREWEAQRGALATVRRFNATQAAHYRVVALPVDLTVWETRLCESS